MKQSTFVSILKGSKKEGERNHKNKGTNPSIKKSNNDHQYELLVQFKTKIQELEGSNVKLVIIK